MNYKKCAIFGTGTSANECFYYAKNNGYEVCFIVDDFLSGFYVDIPIVNWDIFLEKQNHVDVLFVSRYQHGRVIDRANVKIPILVPPSPNISCFSYSENIKRIRKLKNVHLGKRCFILGNGPSLKLEDIEKIKSEITFASNKIFLIFEETDWRPNYYFVEDVLVAKYNKNIINDLSLNKFFEIRTLDYLTVDNKTCVYQYQGASNFPGFSYDVIRGVLGGYTVIASQLQFAYYMGFNEVYLLGLDFKYKIPTSEKSQGGILVSNGEINHFHPNYRMKGEKWTYPQLDKQKMFFDFLAKNIVNSNFRVYNVTINSSLDSFDKLNLDDII